MHDGFVFIMTTRNGTGNDEASKPGTAGGYDEFLRFVKGTTMQLDASSAVVVAQSDVEANSRPTSYHPSRRGMRSNGAPRRASTTEERRNSFAPREGNALIWRNISMTLVSFRIQYFTQSPME